MFSYLDDSRVGNFPAKKNHKYLVSCILCKDNLFINRRVAKREKSCLGTHGARKPEGNCGHLILWSSRHFLLFRFLYTTREKKETGTKVFVMEHRPVAQNFPFSAPEYPHPRHPIVSLLMKKTRGFCFCGIFTWKIIALQVLLDWPFHSFAARSVVCENRVSHAYQPESWNKRRRQRRNSLWKVKISWPIWSVTTPEALVDTYLLGIRKIKLFIELILGRVRCCVKCVNLVNI